MPSRGPSYYPPQNNRCGNPCYSDCVRCTHFSVGDRIYSFAGRHLNEEGRIRTRSLLRGLQYATIDWDTYGQTSGKYVQNFRLLLDQNDIEFHKR